MTATIALLSGLALPAPPAQASSATASSVAITVNSVSPAVPKPSNAHTPLTVRLTLTNRTGTTLDGIRIVAERDLPITSQAQLDKAIAGGQPSPDPEFVARFQPATPLKPLDLGPHATATLDFTTYTTTAYDQTGLCLCHTAAIYPLYFSAHVTSNGVDQSLGFAQTFLPATDNKPAKVQVAWLWPLVDRPHRLTQDTVFTDDDLAASVTDGGRLARALSVVEQVEATPGTSVPITLLVDPELIDELAVMATGKYTVTAGSTTKPGTGQAVAAAWLGQLRNLLANPAVNVQFTPYADPDVETLTQQGLTWTDTLPDAATKRITDALGPLSPDTVSWPAGSALGAGTLRTLVKDGTGTVIVDSKAVTPGGGLAGLARLGVGNTDVAAVLTSAAIEKYVGAAVTAGGPGSAAMPALMAEIAVRTAQEPDVPHGLLITAPRYVDPSVDAAVATILQTSSSTFTTPTNLATMVSGNLLPVGHSQLAKVPSSASALSATALAGAKTMTQKLPPLRGMLDTRNDPNAATFLAGLPIATQRIESAGWHGLRATDTGDQLTRELTQQVATVLGGVHIVRPASGTYTLASSNSPLPVTVENDLHYTVRVRISVVTANKGLGFTAKDIGVQTIEADSKRTLHLPTNVERSGRIRVQAQLFAPDGRTPLGGEVDLTVRSTALGFIGIVITIVAGVVLALALIVRFVRRIRRRGAKPVAVPADGAGATA